MAGELQRQPMSRRAVLAAMVTLPLAAACGSSGSGGSGVGTAPDGVTREEGRLRSRHWPGRQPHWVMMRPEGTSRPSTVISLHGKDGDAERTFSELQVQRFIETTGLAVAAIDGANYYWHARRSESTGADDISPDTPPCDTGAMVMEDFVPLLTGLGLNTSRLGLLGWSMGGYGALLLAAQHGPERVAAVAPMSAALWTQPGLSAPGAFDGAEDWARNDVFADLRRFANIPIRLVCGSSDPFFAADQQFVAAFPTGEPYDVTAVLDAGGHDGAYWASHVGAQLSFLARHLRAS